MDLLTRSCKGGSIRCPSAHCGIYGFKPSCKRLPNAGASLHMAGKETILSTLGPMTVDREALELFVETALAAKPWLLDPSLNLREWAPHKFDRPLKIGVQWWDGVVKPHPPMIRTMREVAAACKAAGMEIVDWDCEKLKHDYAWDLTASLYWPDGGAEVMGLLKDAGEPILPLTKFIIEEQPAVKHMTVTELFAVSLIPKHVTVHLLTTQSARMSETYTDASTHKPGPRLAHKTGTKSMSFSVHLHSAQQRLTTNLATGAIQLIGISSITPEPSFLSPLSIPAKIPRMRATLRRTRRTSSATTCTHLRSIRTLR